MSESAPPALRIHPADDVAISRRQLLGGTRLEEFGVTVSGLIPPGVTRSRQSWQVGRRTALVRPARVPQIGRPA